ncbi:MAG: 3-deoxy-D-manno-octulosonic acid transferase, partial [Bacteroidetes bacterium]
MIFLFYQIGIRLFYFGSVISLFFNSKARLFVKGRKDIFKQLDQKISGLRTPDFPLAWFHCASLGEFEQARYLIEKIKGQGSRVKILITFFSPSGYEIRKNYDGADFVFYLPVDTQSNVKRFLDIVNPSLVFFVKYDFWYNYLNELNKREIPTYLVSANFRLEQFKGMYGKYLRKVLEFFTKIFVQNESSKNILAELKIENVAVSGDLRYDKVAQAALNPEKLQLIHHFKGEKKIFIAGSTWKKDEEIISGYSLTAAGYKLIIAPHEVNEAHIESALKLFPEALRYSMVIKESVTTALDKLEDSRVIIIDNIGMLSNLYQYADIAYIGGGFGAGIHNILEAVAFGVPVIFGPHHQKFPEANEIIEHGGGFCITDANDFNKVLELLLSDEMV